MKLHFKIISCSSQDLSAPVTNLVSGSGMWQSSRFCQYPQQITIQFYQPVTLQSIHIASHPTKITTRINILFYLPDSTKINNMGKFQKFGYLQLGNNQNTDYKLRELKKIQDIKQNAAYVRIILWKNYQNPHNFFNQVGLSQFVVYGNPLSINILPPVINNKSMLMNLSINDYIQNKLQVLQQFKQQFTKQDDFQSAKKIKQIIKVIKIHGQKLKKMDQDKKNAVGNQQYQKAKQIKNQMQLLKNDIQHIANNFYDPDKKMIKPMAKQTRFKAKMDQILSNTGNTSLNQSRVSNNLKKLKIQVLEQEKQVVSDQQQNQLNHQAQDNQEQEGQQNSQLGKSKISYDNRIIPAVLKKNKKQFPQKAQNISVEDGGFQDNQFLQKPKNQQEIVLEEMTPSAQVNAAVLTQFYQKQIIRKLHSKHWNFKMQALNNIMQNTKKWLASASELQKDRVKSVLFTFNKIVKQGNFQLTNLNLDLLLELLNSKKAVKNIQSQLHNDIEKSIHQVFLKMGDNQKIKQKCQDIINKMLINNLYGVNIVYQAITKSYFNQTLTHNIKIKKYKISVIDNILDKYGIGSANGLPMTAVDFMCKVAEDNNDEIRKQATIILKKMKTKGAGNKVIETVRSKKSLKGSIVKQIES